MEKHSRISCGRIKGILLNDDKRYYSFFREVFTKIPALSSEYNWLISGIECYPTKTSYQQMFSAHYVWLTGDNLLKILQDEDIQWIWGVFSGFKTNIPLQKILASELPIADGNTSFWRSPLKMAHPLATVEIIAWDSSCSLFISSKDRIINDISRLYPEAMDLEQYNQSNNS